MTPKTLSILTNREVIALDQDAKGIEARRISQEGPLEVWSKSLADGSVAVGLFNRGESSNPITLSFKDIGAQPGDSSRPVEGQGCRFFQAKLYEEVPRHGVVLLRVQSTQPGGSEITGMLGLRFDSLLLQGLFERLPSVFDVLA
jgi:alpha-galactosidase